MFENPFSSNGRIRRSEYWVTILLYAIGAGVINIVLEKNNDMDIIGLAYIPLLWLLIAQGAKRCHDVNNSGWMQIIPFYGLWMLFQEGDNVSNSYGKNPKEQNSNFENTPERPGYSVPKSNSVEIKVKPAPVLVTPQNQTTVLEVANVNYSLIQDIMKSLRTIQLIHNHSYEFSGTTATITIRHSDTSQTLLDHLFPIMNNIEVRGVGDGFITLKMK